MKKPQISHLGDNPIKFRCWRASQLWFKTRVASYGIYTVWRVLLAANLYVLHFAHVAFFYIAGLANPDIFPRSAPAWVSFGGIKDAAG